MYVENRETDERRKLKKTDKAKNKAKEKQIIAPFVEYSRMSVL